MNKKGFTLIELLSVVVILAVVFLFVTPKLVQLIKEGEDTNRLITNERIIEAVNKYIDDNNIYSNFYEIGDSFEIETSTLIENGYLKEDEIEKETVIVVELTSDDRFSYTISES